MRRQSPPRPRRGAAPPAEPDDPLLALPLVPPTEREGAADGDAPPPPPPEGTDGRLTAPPLPPLLRDGGPDGAEGAGPGDPEGDLSTRPRGAVTDRLGPRIGSERGALGKLYDRDRGSAGSARPPGSESVPPMREAAGWRPVSIRERGATVRLAASSVGMRARGAVVSGMLLPILDREAGALVSSSIRERGDAARLESVAMRLSRGSAAPASVAPPRESIARSDEGSDGATRVRGAAASRDGRLAAPEGEPAKPDDAPLGTAFEGVPRGTARGPVGDRSGSARDTARAGAPGVRRASANCVRTAGEIASTATACCATTTCGFTTGVKLRAGTTVHPFHGP
jgi:hypothetical protein